MTADQEALAKVLFAERFRADSWEGEHQGAQRALCFYQADAILASEWLAAVKAEAAAEQRKKDAQIADEHAHHAGARVVAAAIRSGVTR